MASEPRNISPSPWPTASGGPLRAPMIRSSSPVNMMASAKAPCSRFSALWAASTGLGAAAQLARDQMRDHLGVGLRGEFVAVALQLVAQFGEILDDAVVDDGDAVGEMRMRVGLVGHAVGRPARVADADRAVERLVLQPALEIDQLAFGAAARELRRARSSRRRPNHSRDIRAASAHRR